MLTKWVQHLRLGAVPVGSEIDLEAWKSRSEELIAATAVGAGTLLAVMEYECEREDIRAELAAMVRDGVVYLRDVVDAIAARIWPESLELPSIEQGLFARPERVTAAQTHSLQQST